MTRKPHPPTSPDAGSSQNAPADVGLFRLSRSDLPALKHAAEELGQAFFCVDLERARNIPTLCRELRRDLAFPPYFGRNLDAAHDCLSDFSWHPAPGYVIALLHHNMLEANPTAFAAFNEVLLSAMEAWRLRDTPFKVFYVTEDASADAPKT